MGRVDCWGWAGDFLPKPNQPPPPLGEEEDAGLAERPPPPPRPPRGMIFVLSL